MSAIPDLKFGYEAARTVGEESIKRCIQCGKCAAICPLVKLREDYSPLEVVKGTLLGLQDIIARSEIIWLCLSCQACTKICPAGIKFQDFIESLRTLLMKKGITSYILRCKRCGKNFTTSPILKFAEKMLPKEVKIDEEYLALCPDCKPYIILNKSSRWYGKGIV